MSYDPVQLLGDRFRSAIGAAFPELTGPVDPLITPSKQTALGDFQANVAMPLAKQLGRKPRDVAQAIIERLDITDVAEPLAPDAVAGPGFINIRLRADALAALLANLDTPDLGLPPASPLQTVVIDLGGVNLAKQMHVGHLRSTIIGDALARAFERLGHRVVRQNHVGDWGLPIAMVTARIAADSAAGRLDLARLTLDQLDAAYRAAQRDCAADHTGLAAVRRFALGPKAEAELGAQVAGAEERLAEAKATLLKLQAHDPATLRVWQRIADVTMTEVVSVFARLHTRITADDSAGESSYAEELAGLVADLRSRAVAEESDGALIIRSEGIEEPCLIRKTDGGFLYATTDLAAIRRRVQKFGAARVIYAVDARQSLHFKQIFAAAAKAGYTTAPGAAAPSSLEHAAFGTVLGEDGRPFKTRSGDNVKLADLVAEAVARAERTVLAKNPDLPEPERRAIAEVVGVAALKYADLSSDRIKDYIFSFDRMLAFEGNTGPYLLYALVRVRSIFRKLHERNLGASAAGWQSEPLRPNAPEEKTLALALLRYPGIVRAVADSLEPHRLCGYLFDLAGAFGGFFDACPVLNAPDDATRRARLRLCDLTARVLTDGLGVLGIPPLERM